MESGSRLICRLNIARSPDDDDDDETGKFFATQLSIPALPTILAGPGGAAGTTLIEGRGGGTGASNSSGAGVETSWNRLVHVPLLRHFGGHPCIRGGVLELSGMAQQKGGQWEDEAPGGLSGVYVRPFWGHCKR